MERGTDWERQQVRERWAVLERERSVATRLLLATSLVLGGLALLAVAVARGVCFTTARGGLADCTATSHGSVFVLAIGLLALVGGLWQYWDTRT